MIRAALFAGTLVSATVPVCALAADDPPALPDPIMTPGVIDPSATVDVVCNRTTRERRNVSSAAKAAVLAAYNIPASQSAFYEIDHLVPLAIGGANAFTNLWPQPWAEADQKDVLEVELQREVCHGLVTQAQAQREIADDWVAAYRRYVGGAPIAVGDPTPPLIATASPGVRAKVTDRLKAEARRLYRSWIFGSE